MKVLVTGSNGLLGKEVCRYFKAQGEQVFQLDRTQVDLFNLEHNYLSNFDCIIHAAANTNVEYCEAHPETCYRDNTLLTERIAIACSKANTKLIYISSTGVYGSDKLDSPYNEYDNVNPTTHHHNSKWLAEQAVNKYCKNALIVRVGWLFGGEINNPKNFVARRIEEALQAKENQINSNNQQKGVPTFVNDVSHILYQMIQNNEIGTFNIVNKGIASRYEYVAKVIAIAGLKTEVIPISQDFFKRAAQVSNNESATSLKLQQLGYLELPIWEESLERYIKDDLINWIKEISINARN